MEQDYYPAAREKNAAGSWLKGKPSLQFALHQQQEQQMQQQQHISVPVRRRLRRKDEDDSLMGLDNPWKMAITRSSPLVTNVNLYSFDVLNAYNANLGKIWSNLVGAGVERIEETNRKITHVHLNAMEKIVAHSADFTFGIVPDNLPAGFFFQEIENTNILCYHPQYQQQIGDPFLRVQLTNEPTQAPIANDNPFVMALLRAAFGEVLERLELENEQLQGLVELFMQSGLDDVDRCLQQLLMLQANDCYLLFKTLFLTGNFHYADLITEEGQEMLAQLAALDDSQQAWWESLTTQHAQAQSSMIFFTLFRSFRHFLNELERLGIKTLPQSCPLVPIRHLQVALDRALSILKRAADPVEQLEAFFGLDFGPNGAWVASYFDDYGLISQQMKLTVRTMNQSEDKADISIDSQGYQFPDTLSLYVSYPQIKKWDFRATGSRPDYEDVVLQRYTLSKRIYAVQKKKMFNKIAPDSPEGEMISNEFMKSFRRDEFRLDSFTGKFAVYHIEGNIKNYYLIAMILDLPPRQLKLTLSMNFGIHNAEPSNYTVISYANFYFKGPEVKHFNYVRIGSEKDYDLFEPAHNSNDLKRPPTCANLFQQIAQAPSDEEAWKYFYRYIGTQTLGYPLSVYESLERLIDSRFHLSDEKKRNLMAAVALLATGETESLYPVKECTAFLDAVFNQQSTPEELPELIKALAMLADFNKQKRPSFRQLTALCSLLSYYSTEGARLALFQQGIRLFNTLSLSDDAFESFVELIRLRKEISLTESLSHGCVDPLEFTRALYALGKALEDVNPSLRELLIKIMLATNEQWSGPPIQRVRFCRDLVMLEPVALRDALLSLLSDINIQQSAVLPSLEQIELCVKALVAASPINPSSPALLPLEGEKGAERNRLSPLEGEKGAAELRASLLSHLQKQLPFVKIGNEPVDELLLGAVHFAREVVNELSIRELLNTQKTSPHPLMQTFGSLVAHIMDHAETLIERLFIDPVDIEAILEDIAVIEADIFNLLSNPLVHFAKPLLAKIFKKIVQSPEFIENHPSMVGVTFEVFCNKRSLLILGKDALERQFRNALDDSIRRLQTARPALDAIFRDYLGELEINPGLRINEQLKQFRSRYDQLRSLINTIIFTKNNHGKDYRALIDFIARPYVFQFLTIDQLQGLLASLNTSIVQQIERAYAIIMEHQPLDPNKLNAALAQIGLLVSAQTRLDEAGYFNLFNYSLRHNLTQSTPFPMQAMISISRVEGVNDELSRAIITDLVRLIASQSEESGLPAIIEKISHHLAERPELAPFIERLLKACSQANQSEMASLNAILDSIPTTLALQNNWLVIMQNCQVSSLAELMHVNERLITHAHLLPELASLFDFKPYPNAQRLLAALNETSHSLAQFVRDYDLDPTWEPAHPQRADNLELQFDTSKIAPVISALTRLHGEPPSRQEQFELAQELVYINTIGRTHPLRIGSEVVANLTQTTRTRLRHLFGLLVDAMRSPGLGPHARHRYQLQLLAVLREMYFRITGQFPYTTQLLVVLMANHNSSNLLFKIHTGQGKSIITALQAVMLWAEGGTVDVLTPNAQLIEQSYVTDGAQIFFEALKIPTAAVKADSPSGTRVVGGINYTSCGDLSIYRQRAKLDGESLDNMLPLHMIIDESDHGILDNRTLFNYSRPDEGVIDPSVNPNEWVYTLIVNDFLNQPAIQQIIEENNPFTIKRELITRVKRFLEQQAPGSLERNQIIHLPSAQFEKWIKAAYSASKLTEGEDFIIKSEEKTLPSGENRVVYYTVPLISMTPQTGSTFSDGVNEFLQKRMQARSEGAHYFPVGAELRLVSSQSANDLFNEYRQKGRILGISGTPAGDRNELLEQATNLDMDAYSIPPHHALRRVYLSPVIARTSQDQSEKIKAEIRATIKAHGANVQPILIVCKNINEARAMQERLLPWIQAQGLDTQLVTGEETMTNFSSAVAGAGHNRMITFATPLMGRGIDIKPTHPAGLSVIQCFLDTERMMEQILGRAARNGALGRYVAIYDEQDLPHRHLVDGLRNMASDARAKALLRIQQRMTQEHAVERYFTQELSSINQVIFEELDHWQAFFHQAISHYDQPLRQALLIHREMLLSQLNQAWQALLQESDPSGRFDNPFIRRDEKGQLQTDDLTRALALYHDKAVTLWNETRDELEELSQHRNLSLPLGALLERSISEQIKASKIRLRNTRRESLQQDFRVRTQLGFALDSASALLAFDAVGEDERPGLDTQALRYKLDQIIAQYNAMVSRMSKNRRLILPGGATAVQINEVFLRYHQYFSDKPGRQLGIQPLVQAFLEFTTPLTDFNELKTIYHDELIDRLAHIIDEQLSWAKPERKELSSMFERKVIRTGAQHILTRVAALKAMSSYERSKGLKQLYKELQLQKMQLKPIWTLSLGHRDTRKVIDDALQLIDSLVLQDTLSQEAKNAAREEALYSLYEQKIRAASARGAQDTDAWRGLAEKVATIFAQDKSIYVFYQLYGYLTDLKRKTMENSPKSPLLPSIQGMINELNHFRKEEKTHQDLFLMSRFFKVKEEQLRDELTQALGEPPEMLRLIRIHTGFSSHFELTIVTEKTNAILETFMHDEKRALYVKRFDAVEDIYAFQEALRLDDAGLESCEDRYRLPNV